MAQSVRHDRGDRKADGEKHRDDAGRKEAARDGAAKDRLAMQPAKGESGKIKQQASMTWLKQPSA